MDGFKMQVEGYKQYLKQKPDLDEATKEHLKKQIRALTPFIGTTEEDRQLMFDSGAFNDICKAYFRKAMKNCGVPRDTMESVMSEFKWLLDTCSAEGIMYGTED